MSVTEDLVDRARAAQTRAYAPYSRFAVGAAVQASGKIYQGVNVENASYGLAMCAERNAVAAAVLDGARSLEAVVVVSDASPPAAPCGACRQVLNEFAGENAASLPVVMVNHQGERKETTLGALLPDAFGPRDLPHG